MTKIWGVILVTVISLVCCTSGVTTQPLVGVDNEARARAPLQVTRVHEYEIGDTLGVVTLNKSRDGRGGKDDFIRIYNEDGSLWHKFTFYGNDTLPLTNDDFSPISFHQDYFVLALKCAAKSEKYFEVVVNEETGVKKYVRVDDPVLKFQTWEEHILQVFAVDFNWDENPPLGKPGGNVKNVSFSKEVTFRPVAVEGEWLKVRWDGIKQTGEKNKNDNTGWVKWKKDGFILVELYYFS